MGADELRDEIGRGLRAAWPAFAGKYPRLAAILDPGVLLDAAADHFADDSDYQHTLADAVARGASEQEMATLIGKLARGWLRDLV